MVRACDRGVLFTSWYLGSKEKKKVRLLPSFHLTHLLKVLPCPSSAKPSEHGPLGDIPDPNYSNTKVLSPECCLAMPAWPHIYPSLCDWILPPQLGSLAYLAQTPSSQSLSIQGFHEAWEPKLQPGSSLLGSASGREPALSEARVRLIGPA
jgi:hypothetical protein